MNGCTKLLKTLCSKISAFDAGRQTLYMQQLVDHDDNQSISQSFVCIAPFKPQVLPQRFNVPDKSFDVIVAHCAPWSRSAAAPLVEENHTVVLRIKEASMVRETALRFQRASRLSFEGFGMDNCDHASVFSVHAW
jgi:hypothetical protein